MALHAHASLPAPAAPKKVNTGLDWVPFAEDEVHPSEAYKIRIANLIPRPKSAPAATDFTVYGPSQDSPGSTFENVDLLIDDDLDEMPLLSRSSSYPNQPTPFPPTPVVDYYTDLKKFQRIFAPNARVLVGNLPYRYNDDELAEAVEEGFVEYGDCRACVFRGGGKNGHFRPYAIVQYTMHQDAMAAYCCGQEKAVKGRKVRVEFSKFA